MHLPPGALDVGIAGEGEGEVVEMLQRRVFAAIGAAYPHLAEECRRQLRQRRIDDGQGADR